MLPSGGFKYCPLLEVCRQGGAQPERILRSEGCLGNELQPSTGANTVVPPPNCYGREGMWRGTLDPPRYYVSVRVAVERLDSDESKGGTICHTNVYVMSLMTPIARVIS